MKTLRLYFLNILPSLIDSGVVLLACHQHIFLDCHAVNYLLRKNYSAYSKDYDLTNEIFGL